MKDHLGETVVVGIRPEHLEDAAVATDHSDDQRINATVAIREALGAETLIHFDLNARHVDSGDPDALDELGDEDVSRCTARFSAASQARVGDSIRVNVDVGELHFFDRSTHLAIR